MYSVLGFKDVDFKDKNSGDKIQGCSLYVSFSEPNDKNLVGQMADKIFLPLAKFEDVILQIQVGTLLDISYNRFGKVQDVIIISK